jgi:hypothetical protein
MHRWDALRVASFSRLHRNCVHIDCITGEVSMVNLSQSVAAVAVLSGATLVVTRRREERWWREATADICPRLPGQNSR